MSLLDLIMNFIEPKNTLYTILNKQQTEEAIKFVKDNFQQLLSTTLRLRRVTAPLFIESGIGINDDLNGIETPVSFNIKDCNKQAEIIHSLAKWKRVMLGKYGIKTHHGLYTDMNAIRPDESLDNLHSLYVDQWDWEITIEESDRNKVFLRNIVNKIYDCILSISYLVNERYGLSNNLPSKIHFITTSELLELYPNLSPKERENKITKKYGAVFVEEIGHILSDGKKHDGRSPDYDDWRLNGDILVWNDDLEMAFELSSMGIRVNKQTLDIQMDLSKKQYKYFHKHIEDYPLSIGGGIGQSRLCMFLLHKAHIGQIQSSIWSDSIIDKCKKYNIDLL